MIHKFNHWSWFSKQKWQTWLFQRLQCDDFLLFSILSSCQLNIWVFWVLVLHKKTKHLRMIPSDKHYKSMILQLMCSDFSVQHDRTWFELLQLQWAHFNVIGDWGWRDCSTLAAQVWGLEATRRSWLRLAAVLAAQSASQRADPVFNQRRVLIRLIYTWIRLFPSRGAILHFRPSDQRGQKTRRGNKPERLRITARNGTVIYYSNPFYCV